ncbi:type II methionyl aminopeptidase [Candidatus Woesearchaeota archaeon]|nr:type II methionyl aminopeptidase [Candidatus Woesearchaeota archaeon]
MLTTEAIEHHKKAGIIAQTALLEGAKHIKPGASMREVLDTIEDRIKKRGAGIAFPAQISLNNIAAHYCPTDEEEVLFKEGDLAKLDIGVHINGRIADNALTINLGSHDDLVKASKEALATALKIIRPGTTLGSIGKAIQETIQSYDLQPIRNLSGHGLGPYQVHAPPSVPNVDTQDATELREGQVIAVEPFATDGKGAIYESSNPTIYTLVAPKPTRSPFTRDVLKTIQSYQGLPFTTRWLTRIHGHGKTRYALNELARLGALHEHPPLPEQGGGLVSQHEHSVIVQDKPLIFTRLDE